MFNTDEGAKFLKFSRITLIVLTALFAVGIILALKVTANVGRGVQPTNVITVNGKGEALAVPDIATFTFGSDETAKTVADAQKAVTDKVNKGIDLVKAAGVDEKDIKTTSYNISPHYQYTQTLCTVNNCPPSRQVIDGYEVSQTIEVKVRDTSKAGTILGQLGSAGLTNISGLNFTVDDEDKVLADAKDKAIADAKQKAEALAKSLGVSLGKVVSFNDEGNGGPIYFASGLAKDVAAQSAPTPQVPVGQNTVTSNVSITYEIY